ncbi:MAG: cupin domain-containing protein [Chloroflexota bacterium]|nr:cupin domain-containing protein [Chloroflexota bacterium]
MSGQPLQKVNIEDVLGAHPPRTNVNAFWVDGKYTLRVAHVRGEYPWHRHDDWDEGWFVHRGLVRIRSDAGDVELSAGEAALIPRGLRHSPLALEDRSTVLIVNARDFKTTYLEGHDHVAAGYREFDLTADGAVPTERVEGKQ